MSRCKSRPSAAPPADVDDDSSGWKRRNRESLAVSPKRSVAFLFSPDEKVI